MKEQRQFERFPLTLPARMETITSGKKQIFELKTRDISSSGAFIYTPEPFPEGARFKLNMTVPSEKIKELTGAKGCLALPAGSVFIVWQYARPVLSRWLFSIGLTGPAPI